MGRLLHLAVALVLTSAGCHAATPVRLAVRGGGPATFAATGAVSSATGPAGGASQAGSAGAPLSGLTLDTPEATQEAVPEADSPEKRRHGGSSRPAPLSADDRYQRLIQLADMASMKNPRVATVAGSVGRVATVVIASGVISDKGSGIISNNGGGIVSNSGAGYHLLDAPTTQLEIDPNTQELDGITSSDVDLGFDFGSQGRTRTWQAAIDRAADGSEGTLGVTVTSDWTPVAEASSVPYKLFQDEVPTHVDQVDAQLDLTPEGDAANRLTAAASASGFDAGAGQTLMALPTVAALQAAIADMSVDVETHYAVQDTFAVLTGRATLKGVVAGGPETLTLDFVRNEATRAQSVTVTSALARVKFTFGLDLALPGDPSPPPIPDHLSAPLYASDDGSLLGDVTWAIAQPTKVTIRLHDGRQLDWDLLAGAVTPPSPEPSPTESPAS